MLKETNDMRRLMGLSLLNEEFKEKEIGVYDNEEQLRDYEDGKDSSMSMPTMDEEDDILQEQASMEEKDAYCQKEFGKDYADCTDKQKEQCDENCGKHKITSDRKGNLKGVTSSLQEDSEGEETYNYGEDEGADEHREDEMEDELHHDKEDMAPHDRIEAIEDHLEALKKDMGYDEDHEDRDEEGTNFAEGKRYSKVLNTLTESQYRKLKSFINEAGPFMDELLTPEEGKDLAKKSESKGLPNCGSLLKKQAQDKQREKLDSYKDNPKGVPEGGFSRVTVDVTLQALAGPLPPKADGVIAMKDGKPFCRVS